MLTRTVRIAMLAVPAVIMAGCASLYPSDYGLNANDALLVRKTCNDVMGLRAGPELSACTGSLAESVLVLKDAELLVQADQSCAQEGHALGTPGLAQCVVMFRRAEAERPASLDTATASTALASHQLIAGTPSKVLESLPKKFYFHMSQPERDERAELSCAQLGLHPAWGSFRQCVFNLQYAIVEVRHATPHN